VERGLRTALAALAALAFLAVTGNALAAARDDQPNGSSGSRNDTKTLQSKLDKGGKIVLKKLSGGTCYRTKGLWVSKSNTTITTNDGACIQYLGPGPVRLTSDDGDPIPADAIFFVNRSSRSNSLPQQITISRLKLIVPAGANDGYGVVVAGSDVTLDRLKIQGAPVDAVQVTPRANGRGWAGPVTITNGKFIASRRNGISVVGAIGVTIDSNTISGAGNPAALGPLGPALVATTGPWAGIDVEPNVFSYPIRSVTISRNTIVGNGGSGVLLALSTNEALPTVADEITVTENTITDNAKSYGPFLRGGICLQGGQADGLGRLTVTTNTITDNGGYGLCKHPFDGYTMQLTVSGNVFAGNELGDSEW
jgi:parallel beta helix pectate lyase-like protein